MKIRAFALRFTVAQPDKYNVCLGLQSWNATGPTFCTKNGVSFISRTVCVPERAHAMSAASSDDRYESIATERLLRHVCSDPERTVTGLSVKPSISISDSTAAK
jgi:hypothetical protein